MTLKQEQKQWLYNYRLLLNQLENAYRTKNKEAIDDLGNRILATQVQIAMVTLQLEENGNTGTDNTVSSTINSSVDITNNPPIYLNCPRGVPRK